MKPLIVTSGDPAGIGPEVVLKAVTSWLGSSAAARPLLVAGDPEWFGHLGKKLKISTENIDFVPVKWKKEEISAGACFVKQRDW